MKLEIKDEQGRIDVVLSKMLDESRSKIQRKIKDGKILVNNKKTSCNYQVTKGDIIDILKEEIDADGQHKYQINYEYNNFTDFHGFPSYRICHTNEGQYNTKSSRTKYRIKYRMRSIQMGNYFRAL